MRTADLHTHFWPQSFLDTTAAGKPWFGWTLESDGGDGLILTGGGYGPYLVKGYHRVDLKDPEMRIGRRIAEQGIDFEAVMIVGYLWSYHLDESESSALHARRERRAGCAREGGCRPLLGSRTSAPTAYGSIDR